MPSFCFFTPILINFTSFLHQWCWHWQRSLKAFSTPPKKVLRNLDQKFVAHFHDKHISYLGSTGKQGKRQIERLKERSRYNEELKKGEGGKKEGKEGEERGRLNKSKK